MNILIVDDEIYAVEAIKEMIDWESLGIKNVYTAYSMKQAQQIFKENNVDILLSDIEMPRGSGIELLTWVRDNAYHVIPIFLTSHANFTYANQAIRLEAMDYILKPVEPAELHSVLQRAIERHQQEVRQFFKMKEAEYWNDSFVQRCEEFLQRVADGRIQPDREVILREAERQHLTELELSAQFYLLLIQLRAETESEKDWGKGLTEYGMKNILSETIYYPDGTGETIFRGAPLIPRLTERHYLLFVNAKHFADYSEFLKTVDQALTACQSAMPCSVTFYPADMMPIECFSDAAERLLKLAADNILYDNIIYLAPDEALEAADGTAWQQILEQDPNLDELSGILEKAARSGYLTRTYLRDIYERTCSFIRTRFPSGSYGIDLELGQIRATSSLDGMMAWLNYIFSQLSPKTVEGRASQDVIETIRRYIRQHINEELGRNELAQLVFLNPDYLSHVFRERVGISLVDFITVERMKKACELLSATDLSIRDVALAVGYSNISYFSRQFKRSQGKTPLEYRRSFN